MCFNILERKKKGGKHGNGMMMFSSMIIVAFLAQLVLGKVTFLAAAALVMAKIALLFSTLVRLKCI